MRPYTIVVPSLGPAELWGLVELLGREFPIVVYDAAMCREHTNTFKQRADKLRDLGAPPAAIKAASVDASVVVLTCANEAGPCALVVAHPCNGLGFQFTPRVAGSSRRPLLERLAQGLGGRVEIGEDLD